MIALSAAVDEIAAEPAEPQSQSQMELQWRLCQWPRVSGTVLLWPGVRDALSLRNELVMARKRASPSVRSQLRLMLHSPRVDLEGGLLAQDRLGHVCALLLVFRA